MSLYKNYLRQEANTNHPIKNTILIYENCIRKFKLIETAFSDLKFREADEHLEKLETAFYELKMSVNEKADEELAVNLYNLYDWILSQIDEMKIMRKADNIQKVIEVIRDLKDGYETVLKKHS